MVATALLYSGRPNPRWFLPASEAVEIDAALKTMSPLPDRHLPVAGLGYSGVTIEASPAEKSTVAWTFSRGVAVTDGRCYSDPERRMEKLVLASGRKYIDPEILAKLLED